jgi:hypothetical protein
MANVVRTHEVPSARGSDGCLGEGLGGGARDARSAAAGGSRAVGQDPGASGGADQCGPSRGLHSSTFRLDMSTFCGVRCVNSVTKTAQVELRSGRV